ncbi:MAG: STAS domain-containing protein, partial [bacterium]|nr:STAS domain-containing protein [bacterium]
LFRSPKSDVLVLVATFLLTVLVDLTVAIQAGVVLAALLFMRRMAEVTQTGYITHLLNDEEEVEDPNSLRRRVVPEAVEVFEVNGPFFFGAADKFKNTIALIDKKPRVLILRLRRVLSLDATGLRALEDVFEQSRREKIQLLLSGVYAQPLVVMEQADFLVKVGIGNVFGNIDDALDRARETLGLPPLAHPDSAESEVRREVGPGEPGA